MMVVARTVCLQTVCLIVALATAAAAMSLHAQERPPQNAPTRDVDITLRITRPGAAPIVERRRWSASQHLRRVDGPDSGATIFDQSKGSLTLLNPANRTYRMLQGPAAKRMSPPKEAAVKRGEEARIAGLTCTNWSWLDGTELHTACLTPDGVLLRLVVDGRIVAEAISVVYAPQPSALFEIPPGYEPALAPDGGPID
jgi:hypothetical protein